jgi:hypothetical protein
MIEGRRLNERRPSPYVPAPVPSSPLPYMTTPNAPLRRSTVGETPHEPPVRPWELELLISGAVIFALLQVPPRLDRWFDAVQPTMGKTLELVVFLVYYYGKLILYVLIGAFGLHLAARAYWVGLIGLESVFPDGVDWERAPVGPIVREVYQERIGPLQPMIDRTDRFCSVIFSAAFSLVMVFFYSILVVGISGSIGFLVSRIFFGGEHLAYGYFAVLITFSLLNAALRKLDQRMGERLGERTRARLKRVARVSYYATGMPFFGTVWLILISNLPRRAFYAAFYVLLFGLAGIFLVKDVMMRSGAVRTDGYALLPEQGSRSLAADHYESLWSADGGPVSVPSIQSDVITGRYLKLFIPYQPERIDPVLRERCPRLTEEGGALRMAAGRADTVSSARADSVLACWARIQPVRLNGRPLALSLRFYRHPVSGLRGVIAYLPADALPEGSRWTTSRGRAATVAPPGPPAASRSGNDEGPAVWPVLRVLRPGRSLRLPARSRSGSRAQSPPGRTAASPASPAGRRGPLPWWPRR